MATLVNCTSSERLGRPAYFRATFAPHWSTLGVRFDLGMRGTLDEIRQADQPLVWPINQDLPVDGAGVFVVDLRVEAAGQTATVSELANLLEGAALETTLRSLERITSAAVQGSAGDKSRAETEREEEAAREEERANGPIGQLTDGVGDVLQALKWVLIIGLVCVGIAYAASAARAAKIPLAGAS